ncbi:MAG: flagellar protein FliT [Candidatus Polarisedimenticolaceae bacterium]|nr:flagellar protein FliT [Candidatus Polarisedimenticolaceae bacterium]
MINTAKSGSSAGNKCRLEQLLAQTQHMHDLAIDGEWEKVAALEHERKNLMNTCFSSEAEFDDPQIAAHYVQEIIGLNKKVITMGAEVRESLGNALGDFQRGRQATQAYQKVGS